MTSRMSSDKVQDKDAQAVRLAALLFCAIVFLPSTVRAQGNIHVGQLRVHPFLVVSETFSDNIYFTPSDRVRDSFMTYTPGVDMDFAFGEHRAEAHYAAAATRYRASENENTTDHNARGLVNFMFGRLFEANFTSMFTKGHEGRAESATGFVQTFRNIKAASSATYHLANRSRVQFDLGKSSWDFIQKESQFRNHDEDLVSAYFFYRFMPKTSVFAEIDRKKSSYEFSNSNGSLFGQYDNLDNFQTSSQVGITWESTEKSKGTIKGGFVKKDFEAASFSDYRGSTASVDVRHEFSSYANLILVGKREVNETRIAGTRYFITTGGYGEFSFRVLTKLAVIARGAFGKDDFSDPSTTANENRLDRTTMKGVGLKYEMHDWLAFEGGYSNRVRQSNFPANDYKEQAFTISASALF